MSITLRSPTTSRKPPTFRRLVGAVLLLDAAEKQARDPGASIVRRLAALDEAARHHAQAWQALTSWTTDEGPSDLSARAAAKLGDAGRRLPLLAYTLRIEAGLPVAFDKEAA